MGLDIITHLQGSCMRTEKYIANLKFSLTLHCTSQEMNRQKYSCYKTI